MKKFISTVLVSVLVVIQPMQCWPQTAGAAPQRERWRPLPPPPSDSALLAAIFEELMAEAVSSQVPEQESGVQPTAGAPAPARRPCHSKLSQLTLRYVGAAPQARVEVRTTPGSAEPLPDVTLAASETFSLRLSELSRRPQELRIVVNGRLETTLDATCGDWVRPGSLLGQFEVVRGLVTRGGTLAPVDASDLRVAE